jgi:hypothetical protein
MHHEGVFPMSNDCMVHWLVCLSAREAFKYDADWTVAKKNDKCDVRSATLLISRHWSKTV